MWACAYCDAAFGPEVVCEVDHVVPLARGGAHDLHNLVPACQACNGAKSDRMIADWLDGCRSQPDERCD